MSAIQTRQSTESRKFTPIVQAWINASQASASASAPTPWRHSAASTGIVERR